MARRGRRAANVNGQSQVTVTFRGAATPLSSYTPTIDQDGTTGTGTVEADGAFDGSRVYLLGVMADHTYGSLDSYDVSVTVDGPGLYGSSTSPDLGSTHWHVPSTVIAQTLVELRGRSRVCRESRSVVW